MPDTIVIIDDSASSRVHLDRLVKLLPDCHAVAFADSAEGLEWCLDNHADLILVDYEMPRPDGLEFIRLLRGDARRDEVPVIMITGCDRRQVRHDALAFGATDFLRKPVDEVEFLARVRNLLQLHRIHRMQARRADTLAAAVERATAAIRDRERESIRILARAAEHRDPETGGHLVRMATYSRLIAQALELDAEEVELIFTAAPMHDVGKIGIPDRILLKPGALDPDELEIMRRHPTIGHGILAASASPLLQRAAEIALCHHERHDGGGYPRRLAGADIPLAGRIVALADVFDALTTVRPYKRAWTLAEARDYVRANRGRHFDPVCVDMFMLNWEAICRIAEVERDPAPG